MRNPGFPVSFESGAGDRFAIRLQTPSAHPAKALIDDDIIGESIIDLSKVLVASMDVSNAEPLIISARSRNVIELSLSKNVFDQEWKLAAVFNLIDNSIFFGQEEDPFITSASVSSDQFADSSLEKIQEKLAEQLDASRSEVLQKLLESRNPPDAENAWPDEPIDYLIDVTMEFSSPILKDARSSIEDYFEKIGILLNNSAFEPEVSPMEWMDEALAPFPYAIEIEDSAVLCSMEMPPSDPALAFLLFDRILKKQYDLNTVNWQIELREGW